MANGRTVTLMADKLEPQKVLDAIKNCCVDDQQIVLEYAYDMIKQMIDNYIPVVRCKDCKYVMRDYHNSTGLKCDFEFHQRCVDGDWYCANGKRKDGENK